MHPVQFKTQTKFCPGQGLAWNTFSRWWNEIIILLLCCFDGHGLFSSKGDDISDMIRCHQGLLGR